MPALAANGPSAKYFCWDIRQNRRPEPYLPRPGASSCSPKWGLIDFGSAILSQLLPRFVARRPPFDRQPAELSRRRRPTFGQGLVDHGDDVGAGDQLGAFEVAGGVLVPRAPHEVVVLEAQGRIVPAAVA